MMKHRVFGTLVFALFATPVWAGIGDSIPANPCPGATHFHDRVSIINVGSGGCMGLGTETAITCTVKKGLPGAAGPSDIAVEFYDEFSGASATGTVCAAAGLAAGSTVTIATGAIPGALGTGAIIVPVPGSHIHASARVFSTGRLHCTAQAVDLSLFCTGGPVLTTKKLPVFRPSNVQHGD